MFFMKTVLLFLLCLSAILILASCAPQESIAVSCEAFFEAIDSVPEHVGGYNIYETERASVETECRNLYVDKVFAQELCTSENSVYSYHCNSMIGFFSPKPNVCIDKNGNLENGCVAGFILNEDHDCASLKKYDDKSSGINILESCYLMKGMLGDDSDCNKLDGKYQEECENFAIQANYDKDSKCGDGVCEYPEDGWGCREDCIVISEEQILDDSPVCGDGYCERPEDCTERICRTEDAPCTSTCPYTCPNDCNHVSKREGCNEIGEPSYNIYKKETFEVFHYKNEHQDEYCALIDRLHTGGYTYKRTEEGCSGEDCIVYEYYCENDYFKSKSVPCENGCDAGACLR